LYTVDLCELGGTGQKPTRFISAVAASSLFTEVNVLVGVLTLHGVSEWHYDG